MHYVVIYLIVYLSPQLDDKSLVGRNAVFIISVAPKSRAVPGTE